MKTISIVIPAYNEEAFIGELLKKIIAVPTESLGFKKEIIVVDDGSKDATAAIVRNFPEATLIQQRNQGKGAAVQHGISNASGDYILVQDADLEYDPLDYLPMLSQVNNAPAGAVYGSRTLGQIRDQGWGLFPGRHAEQGFGPWLAGVVLSLWTYILYGRWISDTLTAYKIYPATIFKQIDVKTRGFETDHELTSKLIKKRISIFEVPINYTPRSVLEGKKIKASDGFIAILTLLRFRFVD